MIRVDQTIVDKDKGNCMQAVLASLFELNLDDAINVMNYSNDDWFVEFTRWVDGIDYVYHGVVNPSSSENKTLEMLNTLYAVNGYFYASVPSKNFKNVSHAVIIDRNGIVVHDPNPDKKWLGVDIVATGSLEYVYFFYPKYGFCYTGPNSE